MIIGSITENLNYEQRVAITPDVVKKYISLGLKVNLCNNYAVHLGISDKDYESMGATFTSSDEIISNSNAILQMSIPNDDNLNKLKKDQFLIGVLNPYLNEKKIKGDCFKKY